MLIFVCPFGECTPRYVPLQASDPVSWHDEQPLVHPTICNALQVTLPTVYIMQQHQQSKSLHPIGW